METTTISTSDITVKEKKLRTNLNGKLDSSFFIHIDKAGLTGIPGNFLDKIHFRFITTDGSHPDVLAKVINSCRQPLQEISETFTLLSHGMHKDAFIAKVLNEVPGTTPTTEMVIYHYQKLQ